MEYAFHIELNISVSGEQAQRLKLLSKVILHISGEMPSLYLIKKNPLNATMRNSYIPVGNWDTETVISSMMLASRVRMKNTTTTSRQPGLIKHWLSQSKEYGLEGWLCATTKAVAALESRKQRMRENKRNSMTIVLPAQDGKEAIFSSKQCSWNEKATSEIRSALCLAKLLLHSAAPEVAWHLLSLESFNWWAQVTTLSTWVTERHCSVGQLCLSSTTILGSAGLSGCWISEPCGESGPHPTKAWILTGWSPSSTQILILMREICTRATWLCKSFTEQQMCLCGVLPAPFISPGPWNPAHRFLEAPTTQNSQDPDCLWTHPLHPSALLWSQIPWSITMICLHLAASQTDGMNLFVGILRLISSQGISPSK